MKNRTLGRHYIKEWRKFRGYSLRTLADQMEREPGELLITHVSLGRIENFKQPYSQEVLEALSAALQCSVSDLLSVDPLKEGDVVDLMAALKSKDQETLWAIINGLPNKTGTNGD